MFGSFFFFCIKFDVGGGRLGGFFLNLLGDMVESLTFVCL